MELLMQCRPCSLSLLSRSENKVHYFLKTKFIMFCAIEASVAGNE